MTIGGDVYCCPKNGPKPLKSFPIVLPETRGKLFAFNRISFRSFIFFNVSTYVSIRQLHLFPLIKQRLFPVTKNNRKRRQRTKASIKKEGDSHRPLYRITFLYINNTGVVSETDHQTSVTKITVFLITRLFLGGKKSLFYKGYLQIFQTFLAYCLIDQDAGRNRNIQRTDLSKLWDGNQVVAHFEMFRSNSGVFCTHDDRNRIGI